MYHTKPIKEILKDQKHLVVPGSLYPLTGSVANTRFKSKAMKAKVSVISGMVYHCQ